MQFKMGKFVNNNLFCNHSKDNSTHEKWNTCNKLETNGALAISFKVDVSVCQL